LTAPFCQEATMKYTVPWSKVRGALSVGRLSA
jgi:hypothetical protein